MWTEAELRAIADICYDEKVFVFSDEIHADLTLPPHTHRPFATVSEKARMNSVTFMSHIQLTGIHIDTEAFTQIFIKNKSM